MSAQAVPGQGSIKEDASPAAVSAAFAPADASRRLADQLNTLSEVVETITYRLLELEERLAAQDLRLRSLAEERREGYAGPAAVEFRLDDTEERLLRIEAMLTGIDHGETADGGHRPLSGSQGVAASGDLEGAGDLDGPFLEEPEQQFLEEMDVDVN